MTQWTYSVSNSKANTFDSYGDLISIMLELQFQDYESSLFNKQTHRFIAISTSHTIDLQQNEEFHLQNPDLNRNVVRNDNSERTRNKLTARFIDPSPFQI